MTLKDFLSEEELQHLEDHKQLKERVKTLEEELSRLREQFEIHRVIDGMYSRRQVIVKPKVYTPQPCGGRRI